MGFVTLGTDAQTKQEVRLGDIERRSGLYLLGTPGMGKSALAVNIALQDIANGHGLFFLDPHGDAVLDLLRRGNPGHLKNACFFDVEDQDYSFGINLLQCENVASRQARRHTYTKAYNVFYKIWEEEFGPWLQLILQNVLRAFIENQGYTLADVPMFLNHENKEFRNHIVDNIKYNPSVADFWRYEFLSRREPEQQARVEAALTRINTLLTDPDVRDIVGQQKSTIDFEKLVSSKNIFLFRVPANLAEDQKKFIGTILLSELVHAVRERREGARDQFCIFIDEFHNFASSDHMATLSTEGRKFGVASTYMHVERFGQLANNQKLMGATQAIVNKALFQSTVSDAREFAPEFAGAADAVKTRMGGELVISPHPVEDIWERGYPGTHLMTLRGQYFWIVDLLKTKPNEQYYVFDPAMAKTTAGNGGKLNYRYFTDWDMYRATPDILRKGIRLLNHYFYHWMKERPYTKNGSMPGIFSKTDLDYYIEVIDCFAGIFGWRPTMEPYIPPEMQQVFVRRVNEHIERRFTDFSTDLRRLNQAREHDYRQWDRANPYRFLYSPRDQYWGERPVKSTKLEDIIAQNKPEQVSVADIPVFPAIRELEGLKSFAIAAGFTQGELGELIQWRPRILSSQEQTALSELIHIVANIRSDEGTYQREQKRVNRTYTSVMSLEPMAAQFGPNHNDLPFEEVEPYLRIVTERNVWQMTELQNFIMMVFGAMPVSLEEHPVYVQSGEYDEAPRRERTQAEMVDVMSRELSNLPRYEAYAKLIDEVQGKQVVRIHSLQTHPLPEITKTDTYQQAIANGHTLCQTREAIEEEIRTRQSRWGRGGNNPPQQSGRL